MKQTLRLLYRLLPVFGIKYGIQLFLKFRFNRLDNIQLPGIKTGIVLRKGTSDIPTFNQIFVKKGYDLDYYGESPRVIIDGGANIGLFSVLMKNKFPCAKIISLEPDKENFEILQKNVAAYSDIICINGGLWNKSVDLKVYDKYEMGKWAMVVEETKEGEGDIKAVSISDLMSLYSIDRIDVLKLDIETSEKMIFEDNYASWLPKVKVIIIELHDWLEEGCSKPFFTAINKTFGKYKYLIRGENTIIINNDIV